MRYDLNCMKIAKLGSTVVMHSGRKWVMLWQKRDWRWPNISVCFCVIFHRCEFIIMELFAKPYFSYKLVHIYGMCSQKVYNYGTDVQHYGTFGCRTKTAQSLEVKIV